MHIKEIVYQVRRDFQAIYECEHCGHEVENHGYDDTYFHQSVIPKKVCPKCGETAGDDYWALTTKYPDGANV